MPWFKDFEGKACVGDTWVTMCQPFLERKKIVIKCTVATSNGIYFSILKEERKKEKLNYSPDKQIIITFSCNPKVTKIFKCSNTLLIDY